MSNLLEYDIRVIGRRALEAEFASIERRLAAHNATVSRLTGMSGARVTSTASVASEARAAVAIQRGSAREAASAAQAAARAEVAAKRQATRDALALGREQRQQEEYWHRARGQSEVQRHREEQRAHRQALQEKRREERKVESERKRSDRDALSSARRDARDRVSFVQSTLGATGNRIGRTISGIGTVGLATVGIGGTALAAGAIDQATKLDEGARRLAVQGRDVGAAGADPDELRRKFTQVGIARGIAPEEVMRGAAAYTAETGDLGSAMANLDTFATVSQAAGASIEEISTAAAHLRKLGITSVDDMRQSLASLTMQGKKGSFELKNMAAEFPEVTAQAATFGIRGVKGLQQVGGLMQVAKTASGSGSEASTAVQTMFRQLAAKSKDIQSGDAFEGRKVDVFEGGNTKGKLRDFRDVLGDILVASKGDIPQLQQVFDVRGIKAVNPLIDRFRETRTAARSGGKSEKEASQLGREAALSVLDNAANVPGAYSEIQRDATDAMKAWSVQVGVLETELKGAITAELFGALRQLGPDLSRLVMPVRTLTRVVVEAARLLGNNPFAGLGAIIAVQLAYEITKARVGQVIKGAVESAVGGPRLPGSASGASQPSGGYVGGGPSGPAGARRAPTGMDMLGAGATGVAAGITIGTAILTAGVVNFQRDEADINKGGERLREALSSNDPERVRQLLNEQREVSEKTKRGAEATSKIEGAATGALSWIAAPGLSLIDSLFGLELRKDIGTGLATVGGASSQTSANSSADFEKRIEKQAVGLEQLQAFAKQLEKAGYKQEEAAKLLEAAARRLGVEGPNRGNSPSPVKS